jgi:hypothetical protein
MMAIWLAGCLDAGSAAGPPIATVTEATTIPFHCVNDTSIHVVTCQGSIALFPITITIDDLRILSDNHIDVLSDELNDLAILDGGILDHSQVLDDVETLVIDEMAALFDIILTQSDVSVCTTLAGALVCR